MNMFTKNQYSKYSLMNSTEVIEKMPPDRSPNLIKSKKIIPGMIFVGKKKRAFCLIKILYIFCRLSNIPLDMGPMSSSSTIHITNPI